MGFRKNLMIGGLVGILGLASTGLVKKAFSDNLPYKIVPKNGPVISERRFYHFNIGNKKDIKKTASSPLHTVLELEDNEGNSDLYVFYPTYSPTDPNHPIRAFAKEAGQIYDPNTMKLAQLTNSGDAHDPSFQYFLYDNDGKIGVHVGMVYADEGDIYITNFKNLPDKIPKSRASRSGIASVPALEYPYFVFKVDNLDGTNAIEMHNHVEELSSRITVTDKKIGSVDIGYNGSVPNVFWTQLDDEYTGDDPNFLHLKLDGGNWNVYKWDLETKTTVPLENDPNISCPVLSAHGNKVVFPMNQFGDRSDFDVFYIRQGYHRVSHGFSHGRITEVDLDRDTLVFDWQNLDGTLKNVYGFYITPEACESFPVVGEDNLGKSGNLYASSCFAGNLRFSDPNNPFKPEDSGAYFFSAIRPEKKPFDPNNLWDEPRAFMRYSEPVFEPGIELEEFVSWSMGAYEDPDDFEIIFKPVITEQFE